MTILQFFLWSLLKVIVVTVVLLTSVAYTVPKQFLKNRTGKQCGYNSTYFLADTAVGGLTGFIPGMRIQGVTSGSGNWNSIFKQMVTKFSNGMISSVRPQTALKMAAGRGVDTAVIPGMGASVAAGGYLSPYIEGYEDQCTCPAN